jgi:hypothetical protein
MRLSVNVTDIAVSLDVHVGRWAEATCLSVGLLYGRPDRDPARCERLCRLRLLRREKPRILRKTSSLPVTLEPSTTLGDKAVVMFRKHSDGFVTFRSTVRHKTLLFSQSDSRSFPQALQDAVTCSRGRCTGPRPHRGTDGVQ